MDQPFIATEIIDALAQMCPTKALGPYGLPIVLLSETLEFSQWGSCHNMPGHSRWER